MKCPKCRAKMKDKGTTWRCNRCGYTGAKTKTPGYPALYPCPACGSALTEELGTNRHCTICGKVYNPNA